jgi:hypothetical protein
MPVLDEIEFVYPVLVQRVGELALVALDDVEAVALGEGGDLGKDGGHFCVFFGANIEFIL